MDFKTFLENFDTIAQAPNGIAKLRSLILDLAVQGKLVPKNSEDEPAELLRNQIVVEKQKLEKSKLIPKQRILTPVQESEQPYPLPNNWCWCRWNDVSLHIGDIDHKMPTEVSEGVPYVSPRDFKEANTIDFQRAKKISFEDFERLRKKVQPTKGDIIFPRYGTIGENRLVEVDIDFLASYSCAVIKNFSGYVEPKYSYYYSLSRLVKSEIERYTNKTTQANVGLQSIQNFIYPLPPFAEQKRIVEKVDELMALCDRLQQSQETRDNLRQKLRASAIASLMNAETDEELKKGWAIVRDNWHNLSQKPEDVNDLRRSILQLAVQGKLVPQSSEDEPAKSTLAKITTEQQKLIQAGQLKKDNELSEIKTGELPSLPQGWSYCYLQDLKVFGPRNGYSPKAVGYPTPVRSITLTATTSGRFDGQFFKYIDERIENDSYLWLQPGDLLIQRSNTLAYVGIAAIYDQAPGKYIYPDLIMRIRLSEKVDVKYVHLFLNSKAGKQHFQNNASGTSGTMPKINQKAVHSLIISLPPLAEQKRIVAKVDELMQICDRLEESLRQSQQRVEALAASAISHLTI